MCMQISAANDSAAFGSRASKFLVTNRTLSYWAQVSGSLPEKSGTRMHATRAKLLVPVSGTINLGGELGSCAMGLNPSHAGRYSIDLARTDGRLSLPRWLVTYRDGLPVHRQSPIEVVTTDGKVLLIITHAPSKLDTHPIRSI